MADMDLYNSTYSGAQITEGIAGGLGAVRADTVQYLSEAKKAQARANIGVSKGGEFKPLGYYESLEALMEAVPNPTDGAYYGVGTSAPYEFYFWDAAHSTWVNNGPLGGSAVSQEYTATLAVDSWAESSDCSTVTISVPGVLNTDKLIISANLTGITSIAGMQSVERAMGTLLRAACDTDGELYVLATKTPSVDIPIKILCIRK